MATHRLPILGWGTVPDSSGEVFFQPFCVLATNDVWARQVCRFGSSNVVAPTIDHFLHGGLPGAEELRRHGLADPRLDRDDHLWCGALAVRLPHRCRRRRQLLRPDLAPRRRWLSTTALRGRRIGACGSRRADVCELRRRRGRDLHDRTSGRARQRHDDVARRCCSGPTSSTTTSEPWPETSSQRLQPVSRVRDDADHGRRPHDRRLDQARDRDRLVDRAGSSTSRPT